MATCHPRCMSGLDPKFPEGTMCIEDLGRSANRESWRLGQVGATGTLRMEATRCPSGQGTKLIDEARTPGRRRSHQGKGPRWSMRSGYPGAGGSLPAWASRCRDQLDRLMPASPETRAHREAWSSMSQWTPAAWYQGARAAEGSWHRAILPALFPWRPVWRWTKLSRSPGIEEPRWLARQGPEFPGSHVAHLSWRPGQHGTCGDWHLDTDGAGD